ncbi:MAG TPA: copper transporter [Actinomycetota bacterium]|nr:copper transporter [Actinomycetota bacterium]
MIDFRYHLISIIAVFLALGIGILMGSLVLGENLVDQLERELGTIERRNDELQAAIEELNAQVDLDASFAQAVYPHLVGSQLEGERVVLFTIEGTDGALLDQVRTGIEDAGGTVGGVVTATSKLQLENQPTRDELALLLSSSAAEPDELRSELASVLGTEAASLATGEQQDDEGPDAPDQGGKNDLDALMRDLQEADFLEVEVSEGDQLVTNAADFMIVGGAPEDPPFPIGSYVLPLGTSLGLDAVPIVAAESSASTWQLVEGVRDDGDANSVLSTVDHADSVSGRIAFVLGLEGSEDGVIGHYGIGPGAQAIIPEMEQP